MIAADDGGDAGVAAIDLCKVHLRRIITATMPRLPGFLLALLILTAVVGLTFGQVLGNQFVNFDDQSEIIENPDFNPVTFEKLQWNWSHTRLSLYMPVTYFVWGARCRDCRAQRRHPATDGLSRAEPGPAPDLLGSGLSADSAIVASARAGADRSDCLCGAPAAGRAGGMGVGDVYAFEYGALSGGT